jgi:hypothetical protein
MPVHTVKQGEYITKIATDYGFKDYQTIWDHPQNASLRAKRKTPNVLYPGDALFIPERELREESRPTDSRHRFKVKTKPLMLRLQLLDLHERVITGTKCVLQVEGQSFELTTDGRGRIEHEIPPTAQSGRLVLRDPKTLLETELPLQIGSLDPVDTGSGQRARLRNLGYLVDLEGEDEAAELRTAIEEFQCDHDLGVDGKCGPATQAKLRDLHGS